MDQNKAVVIGNGESRKQINLQLLIDKFETIGCNAVHRDTIVNHLVCCDIRMVQEAILNVNTRETKIYTRKDWINQFKNIKNILEVPDLFYQSSKRPDLPRNWGSGCYALLVASLLNQNKIFLLGFDLYGNNNKINNIYKGTKNYRRADSDQVDPAYWIYHGNKIFEHFNYKEFYILNNKDWKLPDSWQQPNVKFLDIENFHRELLQA